MVWSLTQIIAEDRASESIQNHFHGEETMRPNIVLFGDSITQESFRSGGWGASLADAYSRKVLFSYFSSKHHPFSLPLLFSSLYVLICRLMFYFVAMADTTLDGLYFCCITSSLL